MTHTQSDMIIIGLTGSIGMGKSTAARLFNDLGVPVHDSDAAVHDLLGFGGEAVTRLKPYFPTCVIRNEAGQEALNRKCLGAVVFQDKQALSQLESILHPLVRARTDAFIARERAKGTPLVILDIPLLFETGGEKRCDAVIVVSASEATQKKRVMARPDMTEDKFKRIVAHQMPHHEKLKRADFVLPMEDGIDEARVAIEKLLREKLLPLKKAPS